MPSSAVRTFSDPGDYAVSIRASTAEVTVTERGQFAAKLTWIRLHRLWMQRFAENLPRTLHSDVVAERAMVSFRTRPGPSILWSGAELRSSNIIRHVEGENAFQRSSGPTCFGAMSLPVAEIVSAGAIAGLDLTPPKDPLFLTPPPSAMARLQRLHAAAGQLAEDASEVIANDEAARGLEQALVEAMIDCLSSGELREDKSSLGRHSLIMRRFRRVLEEEPDQPLYITEICKMIGVSERTLQVCCHEQLGVGPKHYLVLRRLHLARRALRETAPDRTTVTDIATRYGFWHFGRFSVEYRSLFGESPSVTLHR